MGYYAQNLVQLYTYKLILNARVLHVYFSILPEIT